MEDSKIIELFLAGSEQAEIKLLRKYGRICREIAFCILNNREEAEECVNQACVEVWSSILKKTPDSLSTCICRITRNIALKKYCNNRSKRRISSYDVSFLELNECIPYPARDAESCTEYELTGYVEDFLDMLDKKSRVMFVKRYWYAEAVKTIAEEFGMTEKRASVKLLRVRKKLKMYLEKRSQVVKKINNLSSAIGNLYDSFILEAFIYQPKLKLRQNIRRISLAAGVCLLIGSVLL
ncbi:MAG: sigma-70 family RNA polymerase sigma factor [Acetatifactor sp.]|nr:sigma-70 family RNA polymerase sigma factor [Acetatifactor sp.]